MKTCFLTCLLFFQMQAVSCWAQEILELRYCVLFDTYQEKQLFNEWQKGQKVDVLALLTAFDPAVDQKILDDFSFDLKKILRRLQKLKEKNNQSSGWIKPFFYQLHRKFLKHYEPQASFAELVKKGTYNCLSGSLLYAYALEYLDVPYVIYEADHHMFLRLFLKDQTLIVDATDPLGGLQQELAPFFPAALPIGWSEAIGLQYFNLGVENFKRGAYLDALRSLRKARFFYPGSERIKGHMTYVFQVYEQNDWLSMKKK